MQRIQTTKELAARIDPQYIRRRSPGCWSVRILSVICLAAAVAWWGVGKNSRRRAMLSPGHVSTAHAMWENNCAVCHDHDATGGFRQSVSDAACLQCHPASAHHPNQLLRAGANQNNPLALAVRDSGGNMRSANCVACHVEHRGAKAMSPTDDASCMNCHAKIQEAIQPPAGRPAGIVTAFNDIGGHPYFGRELLKPGKTFPPPPPASGGHLSPVACDALRDPVPLHFKHGLAEHLKFFGDDCQMCHVNTRSTSSDGQNMRPAYSFAKDCQSCHLMKLPGGASIPHVKMELVLKQIAPLEDFYKSWIAGISAPERARILGSKDPEQWAKDSAPEFRTGLSEWASALKEGSLPGANALEKDLIKLPDEMKLDPDAAGKDLRLVAAYIAYGMKNHCATCHDVQLATSGPETRPIAATTTSPVDKISPNSAVAVPGLSTVATGIAQGPRPWFIHATFDHRAHQHMTCSSCHVLQPGEDMPVPNLTWQSAGGKTVSCTMCHHPPEGMDRGAQSNCMECHVYHDRSQTAASPTAKPWPADSQR